MSLAGDSLVLPVPGCVTDRNFVLVLFCYCSVMELLPVDMWMWETKWADRVARKGNDMFISSYGGRIFTMGR